MKGKWLSGDFHQHTYYTDGSTTFDFVMEKNNEYGLDWWANSEHGGSRNRDGNGHLWTDTAYYPTNPILGDVSGTPQVMWRWQSLRDFVYPDIGRPDAMYMISASFPVWNGTSPAMSIAAPPSWPKTRAPSALLSTSSTNRIRTRVERGSSLPYGELVKRNGRTLTKRGKNLRQRTSCRCR